MTLEHHPDSLFDAWQNYVLEVQGQNSPSRAYTIVAQAKTALIRYMLPYWNLAAPQGNKLTQEESDRALDLMKRIELNQLQSGLVAQHSVFVAQKTPERIRRTYRAALAKFLNWCQQQDWFQSVVCADSPPLQPPKQRKRSSQDLRNPQRSKEEYRYALGSVEGDVINASLQAELAQFQAFRLDPQLPSLNPVQAATLNRELSSIHQILGWLHRIKNVRLEALSLNSLVPYLFPKTKPKQVAVAAQASLDLAYGYINWLKKPTEEGGRGLLSSQLEAKILRVFLSVARFLYRAEIAQNPTVPMVVVFEQELIQLAKQEPLQKSGIPNPPPPAARPKISDWEEVLALVEQLRLECSNRLRLENQTRKEELGLGEIRSLSAIAQSYQRFLLFALMSYILPARPQTYRTLLINADALPSTDKGSGYCCKQDDVWYMHLTRQNREPNQQGLDRRIEIPNIQYSDGRCFYQYLQEWLFEYTYINQLESEIKIGGLRQVFHPQHPYFFTQKNGTRYEQTTSLSQLVRDASYRLTGKIVTPDAFRRLFLAKVNDGNRNIPSEALDRAKSYMGDNSLSVYEALPFEAVISEDKTPSELAQAFIHANN